MDSLLNFEYNGQPVLSLAEVNKQQRALHLAQSQSGATAQTNADSTRNSDEDFDEDSDEDDDTERRISITLNVPLGFITSAQHIVDLKDDIVDRDGVTEVAAANMSTGRIVYTGEGMNTKFGTDEMARRKLRMVLEKLKQFEDFGYDTSHKFQPRDVRNAPAYDPAH